MSSGQERVSESRVRVRYSETDKMGVAYHGEYLPWLTIRHDVVPDGAGTFVFANERGKQLTPRDVRRILDRRSPTPTGAACAG